MTTRRTARRAAVVVAAGLAGLASFQLLLAAGAPLGAAAWGGTHEGRLPTRLRVSSGVSIVVYGLAAAVVLQRGGLTRAWLPRPVAGVGTWLLVVLLTLGTLANVASQSPWERFLLGPVTLLLAGACVLVARGANDGAGDPPPHPSREAP